MADLTPDIATQAVEPAASSADGQSSSGRDVGQLIKAQQFLDAKVTQKKRRRGVLFTKLVAPGALNDEGTSSTGTLSSFSNPGGY